MKSKLRPMLAATCDDLKQVTYPVLATPKIDGIRCLVDKSVAWSRSLKRIPNRFIQRVIGVPEMQGADGELLVGASFQAVTSGIMTASGQPRFTYYLFDFWDSPETSYRRRMARLEDRFADAPEQVTLLLPVFIADEAALEKLTLEHLAQGYEGTMIRSLSGGYKYGRATFNQGWLLKVKPFEDDEAECLSVYEQMQNTNAKVTNELGLSKRSAHQANKVGKNTLGGLVVRNKKFGVFNVGTGLGLDNELRQKIWDNPKLVIGKKIKFRYQKCGTKDKPRIPIFLGIRDQRDM